MSVFLYLKQIVRDMSLDIQERQVEKGQLINPIENTKIKVDCTGAIVADSILEVVRKLDQVDSTYYELEEFKCLRYRDAQTGEIFLIGRKH